MNENLKDLFARLAAPFHPQDLEWRTGAANADKTRALALAYITSRAVMDRLDEVVGPQNWKDEYAPGPDGGVICGLSLRIESEWITKWDGADNTDVEAIKGGLSDAFKRAGYKWGIGRYLYKLESVWVPCEQHGKSVTLKSIPNLPEWALPDEWVGPTGKATSRATPPSKPLQEREQELLSQLGYPAKPVSEPAALPVAAAAPKNGNGNGNGAEPKPNNAAPFPKPQPPKAQTPAASKRSMSWGVAQVETLLKNNLAANPVEVVRLLNESNLPGDVTPAQILAHFQK